MRKPALTWETLVTPVLAASAVALLTVGPTGCTSGDGDGADGDRDAGGGDGDAALPPAVGVYRRGSLTPQFELPLPCEQVRFHVNDQTLQDSDYIAKQAGFVSVRDKLYEIMSQIMIERGMPPEELVNRGELARADLMPFRGNPSDLDIVRVGDRRKVFVPLGGNIGTPGNEVAVVEPGSGEVARRLKVGVRPVRIAAHPDGVVFVCNQYSNYISIIDAVDEVTLVRDDGEPVEVATDFYCADLLVAPAPGGELGDRFQLYVANQWRGRVSRYQLELVKDRATGRVVDVIRVNPPAEPDLVSQPDVDIGGVGSNPQRLRLSEDGTRVYVANGRGGELAAISALDDSVLQLTGIGAPSSDVIQLGDAVFVPTTTRDRGLLSADDPVPEAVQAAPIVVTGLDDTVAEAHPGALFDGTRAYNFEDVRNGIMQLDQGLSNEMVYYTDDISPEASFTPGQKVLAGALPIAAARNAAGDRLYLALSGSAAIQELEVDPAAELRLRPIAGGTFQTAARPFAMVVDEVAGQLLVASWGGEVLEVFDLADRSRIDQIDLGYASLFNADYPATNIERGELLFYTAAWSNNGRKACASCHTDDLLTDGLGFSVGTTAPTALHQVRPNFNLISSDRYLWNGSEGGASFMSFFFRAQTRTNCELVAFGLVEGPASDPATRVGDPIVRAYSSGNPAACRPEPVDPATGLPANFDAIQDRIAVEEANVTERIGQITGLLRDDVARLTTWYSLSQLRVPPNPLRYLHEAEELDPDTSSKIELGEQLFTSAGCADCHSPDNIRAPFGDGFEHGPGAEWPRAFAERYEGDPRISQPVPGAGNASVDGVEQSLHHRIDSFMPFCFDGSACLVFEDPIAAAQAGEVEEETRRLELLDRFHLTDPDNRFIPGNVVGQPRVNTPSLRGAWWTGSYLHDGRGRTVGEVVLGPGHPALPDGEKGHAVDADNRFDVHGNTSGLAADQVEALALYVESAGEPPAVCHVWSDLCCIPVPLE